MQAHTYLKSNQVSNTEEKIAMKKENTFQLSPEDFGFQRSLKFSQS